MLGTVSQVSAVNGGSVSLNGTNKYLSVPGSADWAVGTGDFTVEWFQYFQSSAGPNTRVFQVGSWPNASIGVSIEGGDGGTLYVWLSGAYRLSVSAGSILNQWVHFAVTRSGTTLRVFKNGTLIASGTNSTNVTDSTTELRVGAETYSGAYFGGYLSNFHFVKGTALYTSPFWPAGPITPVANSKLLLTMTDAGSVVTDSSGTGKIVTAQNGAAFDAATPFPWTGGGGVTTTTSTTTTTTTTSTTTTTTTTVPPTTAAPTTTAAPVATTTPVVTSTAPPAAAGGTTPGATTPTPAGSSVSPTTTVRATTTTVASAGNGSTAAPSTTTSSTTTTTTTTLPPVPPSDEVPSVAEGEAAALVGGKRTTVQLNRLDNEIVLTVGSVTAVIGSQTVDGDRKPLSADGGVSLEAGGKISVRMEGLEPESEVEGLLYSDPTRLGTVLVNDAGRVDHSFTVPAKVTSGSHRFVVRLVDAEGNKIDVALGVVNTDGDGGGIGLAAIVLVVLGLGVAAALFLPAVLRKRRDVNSL